MRLHMDDRAGDDPLKRRLADEAEIYLNGERVPYCIMADDGIGKVEFWGNSTGENYDMDKRYVAHGNVEIRDPRGEYIKQKDSK